MYHWVAFLAAVLFLKRNIKSHLVCNYIFCWCPSLPCGPLEKAGGICVAPKFCDGLTPVELPGLGKISHSPSLNVKKP